jgi:hypothetical protein
VEARFRVGGLTVQLSGRARALEALSRAWAGFAAPKDGSGADAEIELEVDPSRPRAEAPVAMPEVRAEAGQIQVEAASFQAEIHGRSARVRGADERFGVESALKVLLASRLAEAGGLLVHGVALAWEGRAVLFTGPSGTGKSTLAALGRRAGLEVPADELVAVWPGWRVEGTPWNEGVARSAALAGVGTLAWAEAARLERAPAANVVRVLAGNVLLPDPGPEGKARAFRAQAALVNAVPSWTLWFAKDGDVGDALREALKA